MLLASQTNPEFELGLVLSLTSFRETPAPGQRPVAALARVDGHPPPSRSLSRTVTRCT